MHHYRKAFVVVAILLILVPVHTFAGSKTELPNDVTIELLGRCLIYSFSYQRMLNEHVGLELGFSLLGGSSESVTFFTGGARFYATTSNGAPCIAAGIVGITSPTDSGPFDSNDSASYFYIGPGFEYRSSAGFLFRGTVYFLIRDGYFVWPGMQVGIAF